MSTRVSQTVKWVTCGYTRTNCCSSSWTGELPSFGSYFVVCLCFCLLCKFSFNTRSMKSGFMDLVRQSEIMDNRKLWWLHKNKLLFFKLDGWTAQFWVLFRSLSLLLPSVQVLLQYSQHEIGLHGLGKTIGNYGQSKIMAPSKSIPDSLLRSSWKSQSGPSGHKLSWMAVSSMPSRCLEREPEFRPPDDRQDLNNLWKRGVVCISSHPLPTSVGSESGPSTHSGIILLSLLPAPRPCCRQHVSACSVGLRTRRIVVEPNENGRTWYRCSSDPLPHWCRSQN